MRGSPLWQVWCVVAAFAFAGWPVYRLTRPVSASPAAVVTSPTASSTPAGTQAEPVELEGVFAPPPGDFDVKYLDQIVAAGQGPQAHFSTRWNAVIPPEGADLIVRVHWPAQAAEGSPAANPTAVRLTARFANGRQTEKTFWSGPDGAVTDVFTIQK